MKMLVALSGYAGSGKDTAAQFLVDQGWTRVAFADPLKHIAYDLGWDGVKDDESRKGLQRLGESVRDHIHPLAWVYAAIRVVSKVDGPVIITDCRYRNEAAWVRSAGGRIVRIQREDVGAANDHISEHDLDDFPFDGVLDNDGTPEELGEALQKLIEDWRP